MKNLFKQNRKRINEELGIERRKYFSPAIYGHYQVTKPAILKYAQGKLLDIGCGDMPYKEMILEKVTHYDTLDIEQRTQGVRFIGNIQKMDMINT